MEEFNRTNLNKIRDELNAALTGIARCAHFRELTKRLGIELELGKCSYTETEATFKLRTLIKGAKTKEQTDLAQMVELHKLDASKTPRFRGKEVKLVGYLRGRPKWCWMIEYIKSGKQVLIADDTAERLFSSDAYLTGAAPTKISDI
jgi:hypothetical protein